MYAIPRIQVDVRCVFTNTVPTGPYRGAGRPEANYALERLVDEAARVTGIDPVRLRRRNLIPRSKFPTRPRSARPTIPVISRPSSTRRWRLRITPSSRSAAVSRSGAAGCAASVFRASSNTRAAFRPRVHRFFRGRQAGARHRRAEHRPGPRHDLSAPRCRQARHSGGAHLASPRRYQSRPEGQPVGRFALDHDGRRRRCRARR